MKKLLIVLGLLLFTGCTNPIGGNEDFQNSTVLPADPLIDSLIDYPNPFGKPVVLQTLQIDSSLATDTSWNILTMTGAKFEDAFELANQNVPISVIDTIVYDNYNCASHLNFWYSPTTHYWYSDYERYFTEGFAPAVPYKDLYGIGDIISISGRYVWLGISGYYEGVPYYSVHRYRFIICLVCVDGFQWRTIAAKARGN